MKHVGFSKWEKCFPWHPVKLLSGKWTWLKTVNRRRRVKRIYPELTFYEYKEK